MPLFDTLVTSAIKTYRQGIDLLKKYKKFLNLLNYLKFRQYPWQYLECISHYASIIVNLMSLLCYISQEKNKKFGQILNFKMLKIFTLSNFNFSKY